MTVIDEIYQGDKTSTPPPHPRIISLANQKGGVGKTTTAINLGTALAAIGERVLIVDLDPQGNASTGLGIDRRHRNCSTYDVLVGESSLRESVVPTAVPRLSFDNTHLGERGADFFAALVARELAAKVPEMRPLLFTERLATRRPLDKDGL